MAAAATAVRPPAPHMHIPQMWTPNLKLSDKQRFASLYPTYINSNKKLKEGRRIPKDKGVADPTVQEMKDVLVSAGFDVYLEPKIHPRERMKTPTSFGRVRVQLKNDDGTPCNETYPDKYAVMLHLAEMIPKLKSRTQQKSGGTAGASGGAAGGGGGGGAGGKKKKGRR